MSLDLDSEEDAQRRKRDWETMEAAVVASTATASAAVFASESLIDNNADLLTVNPTNDHRLLHRSKRRLFRHDEALICINRDYLGQSPLFSGTKFVKHFGISRARFQRIFDEVSRSDIPFYINRVDEEGEEGASLEARLLLPLKAITYGLPPTCLKDYFQMSDTMCHQAMLEFDAMMQKLFKE